MKDNVDFVFGGGGRICMGRYLAMLEIKKLIATLYSLFDVSGPVSPEMSHCDAPINMVSRFS